MKSSTFGLGLTATVSYALWEIFSEEISNNTYSACCNRAGGESSAFLKKKKKKKLDKRPPSSSSVLGLINAERNINCLFTSCSQNGTDMVMLLQNVEIVVRHPKRISFFFSALQAPFCMVVIFWVTFLPPWVSFYRESFSNHEGAEAKTSLLTRLRFILRREYSDSR